MIYTLWILLLWTSLAVGIHAVDISGVYLSESRGDWREALSLRNRDGKVFYVHVSDSDVRDPTVLNAYMSRGVALVVNDQVYIALTSVRADQRGAMIPFSHIADLRFVEKDGAAFLMDATALNVFRSSGLIPAKGVLRKVAAEGSSEGDLKALLRTTPNVDAPAAPPPPSK